MEFLAKFTDWVMVQDSDDFTIDPLGEAVTMRNLQIAITKGDSVCDVYGYYNGSDPVTRITMRSGDDYFIYESFEDINSEIWSYYGQV